MRISPNFQSERELEFAVLNAARKNQETYFSHTWCRWGSQFKFLLNLTVLLQFAFRRCHKMDTIVECAGHNGCLLGER